MTSTTTGPWNKLRNLRKKKVSMPIQGIPSDEVNLMNETELLRLREL